MSKFSLSKGLMVKIIQGGNLILMISFVVKKGRVIGMSQISLTRHAYTT